MILGHWIDDGSPAALDLDAVLAGRLAIIANSGAGKSWTLRKVLEITAGSAQQIVLDRDDDLYTLREFGDYVLAGGDTGDVAAPLATARRLGAALVELGVSAIVQLNRIAGPETDDDLRRQFVADFLGGVMSLGREHWHPMLVVVDEAQVFVPSPGRAISSAAVKALMSQGRKRQCAGILTSQRLPKIHPDARGDVQTWLIGRVGQSLDRRIACDLLGFSPSGREAMDLQTADPGVFWAFGPALSRYPRQLKIGPVRSTHIRPGGASVPPPPPPERVRAVLSSLVAAETAETEASAPDDGARAAAAGEVERRLHAQVAAQQATLERLQKDNAGQSRTIERQSERINRLLGRIAKATDALAGEEQEETAAPEPEMTIATPGIGALLERELDGMADSVVRADRPSRTGNAAARMLDMLQRFGSGGLTRHQLAVLVGIKVTSGHLSNSLSDLRQARSIIERDGRIFAADPVAAAAHPPSVDELLALWRPRLGAAARRMLDVLVESAPAAMPRGYLAERVGIRRTSGHLSNSLSELRTAGLVETQGGEVRAAPEIFGS
jgi:hypothetical protein